MNHPTNTQDEWEELFENSMRDGKHPLVWPNGNTNWDGVKSFIRQHFISRAEVRRVIDKFIDENDDGMWWGREILDNLKDRLGL